MYLLAFDIGTSALKTTILSEQGHVAASATFAYPTRTEASGIAEQDPGLWWQGVCQTSRELATRNPAMMRQIAGIGVSGHMLGCLPLDSRVPDFPGKMGSLVHVGVVHPQEACTRLITNGASPLLVILNVTLAVPSCSLIFPKS